MTESMREAFEAFVKEKAGSHLTLNRVLESAAKYGNSDSIGEYCDWPVEFAWMAWQAASTQPQQWIKCSDKYPTWQDVDDRGEIWVCLGEDIWLSDLEDMYTLGKQAKNALWLPTNLKRPEPPKE